MTNNERLPALRVAIDRMGGIVAFSQALGVKHQAVYAWFSKGYVPLERAVEIERLTNVDHRHLVKSSVLDALEKVAANSVL